MSAVRPAHGGYPGEVLAARPEMAAIREFWRSVPCGHPRDPVAAGGPDGPICHCGWLLHGALVLEWPALPQWPIVRCERCGCAVAVSGA